MQLTNERLQRVSERAHSGSKMPLPRAVRAYLDRTSGEAVPARRAPRAEPAAPRSERRESTRVTVSADVVVRRIGGFNFEVAVRDVSARGCRVELLEPCAPGDAVIARFPQLEPLGSRVCWASGTTTGMEFATTIHPAVFDSLIARLGEAAA